MQTRSDSSKVSFLSPVLSLLLAVVATVGVLMGVAACSAAAGGDLHGTWYFASGESDGKIVAVYGTLKLEESGRYEDSHRISGILTFSKGTYKAGGGKLTLTPDAGTGSPLHFTTHKGPHTDKDGKTFDALTLTGSSGLIFVLTQEKRG